MSDKVKDIIRYYMDLIAIWKIKSNYNYKLLFYQINIR